MTKVDLIENHIKSSNFQKAFDLINNDSELTKFDAKDIFLFLYDYTNSFKNSNTTPEILSLAGEMLKHGIEHDKLIVNKTKKTFSQMKLCSEIIKRVEAYKNGEIYGAIMPKEVLENYGIQTCIGQSFMSNILITIAHSKLCFLIIEKDENQYKVFLGSKFDNNNIEEIKKKLGIKDDNNIVKMNLEEIIKIIAK